MFGQMVSCAPFLVYIPCFFWLVGLLAVFAVGLLTLWLFICIKEKVMRELNHCTLCPRKCGVNRLSGQTGYCGATQEVYAGRAALHFWEEPCLSHTHGSGTVFFSHCTLGCVYCQNQQISQQRCGYAISLPRLSQIFLELQAQGAHNINLVTPTHYVPQIRLAVDQAKTNGFHLPIVYNTSGYELPETIRSLENTVDIFLPDLKYLDEEVASRYSHAANYPHFAKLALEQMVRQTGPCVFSEEGLLEKGVVVRHLLLPGQLATSKKIVRYLYSTYGDDIYLSLMSQYTPVVYIPQYPELNRKVSRREYESLLDFALRLGVKNCYIQEGEAASESFIPSFDGQGLF